MHVFLNQSFISDILFTYNIVKWNTHNQNKIGKQLSFMYLISNRHKEFLVANTGNVEESTFRYLMSYLLTIIMPQAIFHYQLNQRNYPKYKIKAHDIVKNEQQNQ